MAGKLTAPPDPGRVFKSATRLPNLFIPMKPSKSLNLKSRAAEKIASRREDKQRLENGESPDVIQRENSIFPPDFFDNGRFLNLSSVVGK